MYWKKVLPVIIFFCYAKINIFERQKREEREGGGEREREREKERERQKDKETEREFVTALKEILKCVFRQKKNGR